MAEGARALVEMEKDDERDPPGVSVRSGAFSGVY